jgi:DNA uptake protein ComE-like DNA-binding protein
MIRSACSVLVMLSLFVLILPRVSLAEYENVAIGARPMGMGGAFVALADDANALDWNPAGLTQLKKLEVTSMHTKLFGIDQLLMDYVGVTGRVEPLGGWMGFAYKKMGTELYNETTYSLTYARQLTEDHSFGINLKQMVTQIWDTPDYEGVGVDLGLQMKVNDYINVGGMIKNLNNPKVNETLPMVYSVGVAAQASEDIRVALDVEKEMSDHSHFSWHVGQEMNLTRNFIVRAGYTSWPKRLHAGFGFNVYDWYVDYAFQNHQVLENTHRISATLKFDTGSIFTRRPKETEAPSSIVQGRDYELEAIEIPKVDKISINTASPADLAKVPGISRSVSNNIVLYRHLHGNFRFLRDLLKVPMLDQQVYDLIKDLVTL